MAFTSAILKKMIMGHRRVHVGSFTNGASDGGGDVTTGLKRVEFFSLTVNATASSASAPVVNETFPLAGGDVTIIAELGQDGYWLAIGI